MMTITMTDQALATIWGIPCRGEAPFGDLHSIIADAADEILKAMALAVANAALRTAQVKKAAKMAIALEALLEACHHDPAAFAKSPLSSARARPDEIEAQVRAGRGPKADTIAKAVAFTKAIGRPCPSRNELLQAAEFMAARALMDDREAALVPILIQ